MKFDVKHAKNPAAGWDVEVTVNAEDHESIASVKVVINGFTRYEGQMPGSTKQWHKILLQQGEYPGENKVVVTALDQEGNESTAVDEWE